MFQFFSSLLFGTVTRLNKDFTDLAGLEPKEQQEFLKFQKLSETTVQRVRLQKKPTKISDVKESIASCLELPLDQFDVISGTKILNSDDHVSEVDEMYEVLVHPKERIIPSSNRTMEEDVFEGSMADGECVRMSCGHAATPENLYRDYLCKLSQNRIEDKCPECNSIWDFSEITVNACLSEDEVSYFSRKMNKVFVDMSSEIRECPNCSSFCTRNNNANNIVECLVCKKEGVSNYTFCWICQQSWSHSHTCFDQKAKKQEMLEKCERVKMGYSDIEDVPKLRACPKCHAFIEHDSGCKTMECVSCKITFCFSCLKIGDGGNLSCGRYDSKCKVAPVQNIDKL